MTTPHRTLQMALDALDAITDDVDGTGLNTMPSFDKALDAIAALREALAAPPAAPAPAAPVPDGCVMVPLMAVLQEVRHALAPVSEYGLPGTRDVDQARLQHLVAMIDRAIAAAPTPAASVAPLTDEQIDAIRANCWSHPGLGASFYYDKFARAIEAAHGITGGKP